MTRRIVILVGVLAVLAFGGAAAYAGINADPEYVYEEEEGVVEGWCGTIVAEFGPGLSAPSIETVVRQMIIGETSPSAVYLAVLEGEPREVAWEYGIVRLAADQSRRDEPVDNPDDVIRAARILDDYIADECQRE